MLNMFWIGEAATLRLAIYLPWCLTATAATSGKLITAAASQQITIDCQAGGVQTGKACNVPANDQDARWAPTSLPARSLKAPLGAGQAGTVHWQML